MQIEQCNKIKAVLMLAMMASAEIRRIQQDSIRAAHATSRRNVGEFAEPSGIHTLDSRLALGRPGGPQRYMDKLVNNLCDYIFHFSFLRRSDTANHGHLASSFASRAELHAQFLGGLTPRGVGNVENTTLGRISLRANGLQAGLPRRAHFQPSLCDSRSPCPRFGSRLRFKRTATASVLPEGADVLGEGFTSLASIDTGSLVAAVDPLPSSVGDALRQDGFYRDSLDRNLLNVFDEFTASVFKTFKPGGGVTDLSQDVLKATESVESAVLNSIGHDLLIFLGAASVAAPAARLVGVTPILMYVILGAILGSHGLNLLTSSAADVELGDFGILFLLFSEGLEVSTERFAQLRSFLPLGVAQISLTAAVLSWGIKETPVIEKFLPLDDGLININNPKEALILALAGALSTSAFVFPVLKERGWEEDNVGKAATSILLLQDLFVAPLLVLLPFIVGKGDGGMSAVANLAAEAGIGFSLVLVIGSYLLLKFFEVVAAAKQTDTFVAFSLLVAVGMGDVAKALGLTDTVGAFAGGVLLANTKYKDEILASILPFRGILLGVFFLDAGSNFDSGLLMREAPTVATGVILLMLLKAFTLFLASTIDRALPTRTHLTEEESVRLSVLLSGGGEFAFVLFAATEKLGVLPDELNALLTTIILITMSLTPVLGTVASKLSERITKKPPLARELAASETVTERVASDAIVICGYGELGSSKSESIVKAPETVTGALQAEELAIDQGQVKATGAAAYSVASIVCFDLNPERLPRGSQECDGVREMHGDGSSAELVRSIGITAPRAIIITYSEPAQIISITQRLRAAFPHARIHARAASSREREELIKAGAKESILETEELAVQLGACLFTNGSLKLRKHQDDRTPKIGLTGSA